MIDLGDELRAIRRKMGKSQKDVAVELGIPQTTWSNYETGAAKPPMKILLALAEKGYPIKGLTTPLGDDLVEAGKITKKELQGRYDKAMTIARESDPDTPVDDVWAKKADAAYTGRGGSQNIKPVKVYYPQDLPEGSFVVPLLDQRLSAGPGADLPEEDQAKALIRVPRYLAQYGENIAALTVDGDSMEPTLHRGDMVVCDSCGWSGEGIYAVRMGGSGFVKRLTKAPGKVVIISDNPKYPVREESEGNLDLEVIGRVHCAITKVD